MNRNNGNGKKWSSATIIGKVESVGQPITHKGARGDFTKREVLIVETGRYKNPIVVEFSGDELSKADELAVGDTCAIHCKVRGREWVNRDTGKVSYFTSFNAQAIAEHDTSERVPESHGERRSGGGVPPPAAEDDDIPF